MKLAIAITLFAAALAGTAQAQAPSQVLRFNPVASPQEPTAIPLGPPARGAPAEQWEDAGFGRVIRNVVNPNLTPYLPDPAKATGAAVIIAPGGGFMMLSIDNEGNDVAKWLAERGVAAFVLKYRLNPTPRDPAAFAQSLAQRMAGVATTAAGKSPVAARDAAADRLPPADALADGLAALRLVRQRAAQWGIDPKRVGFMGFSAGAVTTMGVTLQPDAAARPDFIAPIYGWMNAVDVPVDAPPLFAALAYDDGVLEDGSLGLVESWKKAGRPLELHIYDRGGHGFGMHKRGISADLWIDQFYVWMQTRGLLNRTH